MSRTKRKRKAKQKLKIIRKRKAGKLVRFVLTNSGRKYSGWSNRYNYQSNIHSIIYKDATFSNDKFQNCIITGCNFNRFFCKCWGRRKQRSFGKNQMRTAF